MAAISVILPVYNRRATVAHAIASVVAQTFTDFELIIIDDGSTDGSDEVIRPYLDDGRVRYYWQPNSGRAAVARNAGIGMAQSPWLAFIDSDDVWLPTKLARQMALVVEAERGQEALDLVIGDFAVETNGELSIPSFFCHYAVWSSLAAAVDHQLPSGWLYRRHGFLKVLHRRGFVATQAAMVRRELISALGCFDPTLTFAEDTDLWLRVAARGRVGAVRGLVHRYLIHGNNLTSVKTKCCFTDTIRVLRQHAGVAAAMGIDTEPLKARLANYHIHLAQLLFAERQWRHGLLQLRYAWPRIWSVEKLRGLWRCLKAGVGKPI